MPQALMRSMIEHTESYHSALEPLLIATPSPVEIRQNHLNIGVDGALAVADAVLVRKQNFATALFSAWPGVFPSAYIWRPL